MTRYNVPSGATALVHRTVSALLGFGGGKPKQKSVLGVCGSQVDVGRPSKEEALRF